MEQDIKKVLQKELDRETDGILDKIDSVQDLQGVNAPDEMRKNIFREIRGIQEEKRYDQLSEEDLEFIQLGKIYAKKKKQRKYKVIIAAAVLSVAIGMTTFGEPERYFEKISGVFVGQEHTKVNSEDGVKINQNVTEVEAYHEIEETFGFAPVRLYYLPEGMKFCEIVIGKEAQNAQMVFESEEQDAYIILYLRPDYRDGSVGNNVESDVIAQKQMNIDNTVIAVKQYKVEENGEQRIQAEFSCAEVSYFLRFYNVEYGEVEKILKNLYFS